MSRWRGSGRDCNRLFFAAYLDFNLVHISLEKEEQREKEKRYATVPNFGCFVSFFL